MDLSDLFPEDYLPEDPLLENRVLSVCSALGGFEDTDAGKVYRPGDEALECLRDLKRYLRRDELAKRRVVATALGRWQILKTDLIPLLLIDKPNESKVNMAIVEILVPITWPLESEDIADAPLQVSILKTYKEALADVSVLSKILSELVMLLSTNVRERSERDQAKIRLVLLLIRNIVAIKDYHVGITASTEIHLRSNVQERMLMALRESRIMDFLVSMAGSSNEPEFVQWNTLLLEIFFHIFLERSPDDILRSSDLPEAADAPQGGMASQQALPAPKPPSILADLARKEDEERKLQERQLKASGFRSRFAGTVTINSSDGKRINIHNVSQAITSIGDALDAGKKEKRRVSKRRYQVPQDEYNRIRPIHSQEARTIYRDLAQAFLESGFNFLVMSVKREMDMERKKIQTEDYPRLIWICSFFLRTISGLMQQKERPGDNGSLTIDFDMVSSMVNVRGLMFLFRYINQYQEDKKWTEVSVCLGCLRSMFQVLDLMANSENSEYREASEVIQNNLYYEESTIDLIIAMVKTYKVQNVGFLQNLIETVHMLLKLMERYSKSNILLMKKKRRQKKPTENPPPERRDDSGSGEDGSENEDRPRSDETAFANENVLFTYFDLLSHYEDLDSKYIHMLTSMFHRIFVKCKAEAIFYKLSRMNLFYHIMNERASLPNTKFHRELLQFIQYCIGRFMKRFREYPMLCVEMLFSKNKTDCRRIEYGEYDEDTITVNSADVINGNDEIEVLPGLTPSQQIGVAVGLLAEKHLADLQWLMEVMKVSVSLRRESAINRVIEDQEQHEDIDQRYLELMQGLEAVQEIPVDFEIDAPNEAKENLLLCNQVFRMLLRLLKFELRITEGERQQWIIPASLETSTIESDRRLIQQFIDDPLDEDGRPLSELVRKVKSKKRKIRAPSERKRSHKDLEADKPKLSDQFIVDSDEDEEQDTVFFEREEILRQQTAQEHERLSRPRDDESLIMSKLHTNKRAAEPVVEEQPQAVRRESNASASSSSIFSSDSSSDENQLPTSASKRGSASSRPDNGGSQTKNSMMVESDDDDDDDDEQEFNQLLARGRAALRRNAVPRGTPRARDRSNTSNINNTSNTSSVHAIAVSESSRGPAGAISAPLDKSNALADFSDILNEKENDDDEDLFNSRKILRRRTYTIKPDAVIPHAADGDLSGEKSALPVSPGDNQRSDDERPLKRPLLMINDSDEDMDDDDDDDDDDYE
ncbi:timeless protein-domain-containing protein [Polychytrium aggregatum]|uniref:timeless protein-domain-containing protein n=1 Tax=Polychytrium aggregatum TaxID=110093 RepID=UPI0022FEA88B|nr:timeless protein-domain-containing protein [Polychytrium aggregatum]KAI9208244.1 timeless protein-domain-containing protein [Polychytrium aggregatum]